MSGDPELLQRRLVFAGAHVCAALVLFVLVILPLAARFGDRTEEIRDNAAQLAEARALNERAARLAKAGRAGPDPFLPAVEERVASADLQAALQGLANARGLQLQAVRGLPARPKGRWRAIPVGLELDGSVDGVRDLVAAIEQQVPFLFVTELTLRPVSDGEDSHMRASLTVAGLLRGPAAPAPGPLLSEGPSGGVFAAKER